MQNGKIITVFGGSGFVGRVIVQKFLQQGYRVRVACRYPERAGDLLTGGNVGQVAVVGCDIKYDSDVRAAVEDAYGVVNCVGILYQNGKQKFHAVQAESAGRIASMAKAAGAERMVHLSAIGADAESGSHYARSKALGEETVLEAFPSAVILRPSVIFGRGDSFFNRFARMVANPFPFIPSVVPMVGGDVRFQPIYVGDVADSCVVAVRDSACDGKTYELGGVEVASFESLLDLIGDYTGRRMRYVRIPYSVAMMMGFFAGILPKPPITMDQVRLLRRDNVVGEGALGLSDLGLRATSLHAVLPSYMDIYTESGRYSGYREAV